MLGTHTVCKKNKLGTPNANGGRSAHMQDFMPINEFKIFREVNASCKRKTIKYFLSDILLEDWEGSDNRSHQKHRCLASQML